MTQRPQRVQADTTNHLENNSESRAAREAELLDLLDQRLAMARGIAEKHNGRLWAESVSGQGSMFHLTLPRA